MSDHFELPMVVAYWDVDRDQCLTLAGVGKLLQEAAIKHADQFSLGTQAMAARQESWMLGRLAAGIRRYPRYGDSLKVVTWSAGIRGFRGYRELRVYHGDELLVSASTLWLYVSLRTKMLARVPAELADQFPVGTGEVFRADLDRQKFAPLSPSLPAQAVSLRYSDFDGNAHLNNTAYFDCLQTALAGAGHPPRPTGIEIQFIKEVPPSASEIRVILEAREAGIAFGLAGAGDLHAQGTVSYATR